MTNITTVCYAFLLLSGANGLKALPVVAAQPGLRRSRIEREETASGYLEVEVGLQIIDRQWWGRSPTCRSRAFTTGRSQSSRASGGAGLNGKRPL